LNRKYKKVSQLNYIVITFLVCLSSSSLCPNVGVLVGETERMRSQPTDDGQSAGVGHNVPRERERHILVTSKTVTVIPEVVVGVHVLEVQVGFLSSLDDLVPQNNLRISNEKFNF